MRETTGDSQQQIVFRMFNEILLQAGERIWGTRRTLCYSILLQVPFVLILHIVGSWGWVLHGPFPAEGCSVIVEICSLHSWMNQSMSGLSVARVFRHKPY